MHVAARSGLADIVEFLLGHDAIDLAIRSHGNTPFMEAVLNNKKDVVMLFYLTGKLSPSDVNAALQELILKPGYQEVRKLLEKFLVYPKNALLMGTYT